MERNRPVDTTYESVALQRAGKGTDLWSAVEAAQYARFVDHDAPESDDEVRAMADFLEAFAACAESWDEVPMSAKVAALDRLGKALRDLREKGLSVYSGTVERDFAPPGRAVVTLPVAVLRLSRSELPALTVMLPREVDVSAE